MLKPFINTVARRRCDVDCNLWYLSNSRHWISPNINLEDQPIIDPMNARIKSRLVTVCLTEDPNIILLLHLSNLVLCQSTEVQTGTWSQDDRSVLQEPLPSTPLLRIIMKLETLMVRRTDLFQLVECGDKGSGQGFIFHPKIWIPKLLILDQ